MATNYKTPGVYLQEPNPFLPSIVGFETAVPCFVGHTEFARDSDGRDLTMTPRGIESMAEFVEHFGGACHRTYYLAGTPLDPVADRDWGVVALPGAPPSSLIEAGRARSNLHDSMRLFYANGGGSSFVVSVGGWAAAPAVDALLDGIQVSATFVGPTMLAVPDAVLLTAADHATVARAMLASCARQGDRMALLDIHGGDDPAQDRWPGRIANFRDALRDVPPEQFQFGAAYFPALATSLVGAEAIDVSHFHAAGLDSLKALLTAMAARALADQPSLARVTAAIGRIGTTVANATPIDPALPPDDRPLTHRALTQLLLATLPGFYALLAAVARTQGVLPPSGAMAGVWTTNDKVRGVWNAPANVGIAQLVAPAVAVDNHAQEDLNAPLDGLAINAIRTFAARGTLVWGARTLDGLSNDWRYIQVRRTVIYIERSVKQALEAMVFKPNTAQTWVTVTWMVESFLHGLWAAGGLVGDSPGEAYLVQAGLGSTMTTDDVLNGVMRMQITVQMVHPAEFIELTFKQQMMGGA